MRINLLFCCLLLGILYHSLAQGSYEDCCLRYVKEPQHKIQKRVINYRRQEADGSCNLPAIVFRTKFNRALCANPEENWATNLMQRIDNKRLSRRTKTRKQPKRN